MAPLLDLFPDVVLEDIALYLGPPDVLSFLSSHRQLHESLGSRPEFWTALARREEEDYAAVSSDDAATSKRRFLRLAYHNFLPMVKWHPIPRDAAAVTSACVSMKASNAAPASFSRCALGMKWLSVARPWRTGLYCDVEALRYTGDDASFADDDLTGVATYSTVGPRHDHPSVSSSGVGASKMPAHSSSSSAAM